MRGSPAREGWKFLYLVRFLFRMDVSVKPLYYDSVPPCLYMDCQLYDVQQMDRAKSSTVSPFLPRYTVSLVVLSSHIRSAPYAVSSALSFRPSCSVAASFFVWSLLLLRSVVLLVPLLLQLLVLLLLCPVLFCLVVLPVPLLLRLSSPVLLLLRSVVQLIPSLLHLFVLFPLCLVHA